MRTCEGCVIASSRIFTLLRCTEIEGCALHELEENNPDAQLMDEKTCVKNEYLSNLVQNAIDNPPLIL